MLSVGARGVLRDQNALTADEFADIVHCAAAQEIFAGVDCHVGHLDQLLTVKLQEGLHVGALLREAGGHLFGKLRQQHVARREPALCGFEGIEVALNADTARGSVSAELCVAQPKIAGGAVVQLQGPGAFFLGADLRSCDELCSHISQCWDCALSDSTDIMTPDENGAGP